MKALFIGAHNDDCEFNIGGTAALLKQKGCDIMFINIASIWHGKDISKETRKIWEEQEFESARILGAEKIQTADRYSGLYFETGEEVKKLAQFIVDYNPEICFIHWPNDNHIEHRAVATTSQKALSLAKVWGADVKEVYAFEAGSDQTSDYFKPDFYIDTESVKELLHKSMMCYDQNTAQGVGLCHYKDILAQFRGSQCLINYAEGVKIIKYPNGSDDFLLRKILKEYFHWSGNGMYPANGYEYF